MSIREFKVLSDMSSGSLSKLVTDHLNKGWELYGNPFAQQGGWMCQAVVNFAPPVTLIKETP